MKLRIFPALLVALVAGACGGSSSDPEAAGPQGAPGEQGAAGEQAAPAVPEANINQVSPRVGLVDREIKITVTTDGAIDLKGAKVDFGDGIEIVKVTPSGAGLVVDAQITLQAPLGKHDVLVTVGSKKLVAKGAFVVAVPLDVKLSGGIAEQGGLARIDISNRDSVWFDTENFQLYPLADDKDPTLIALANQGFTATDGSVVLLGDPLAKLGPLGFLGVNNPSDPSSASYLTALDAVKVSARSPVPLTAGTPVLKTFEKDLETAFYAINLAPMANEGLIVDARARVPEDSTMAPMVLAYPASGTVIDLVDQKTEDPGFPAFGIPATEARIAYPVTAATKGYFIVVDSGLGFGPTTKMSFEYSAARAQIMAEKTTAHDTAETAQNLGSLPGTATTVPGRIVTGEIKAAGESDFYTFTGLSAGNVTDMLVTLTANTDVVVRVDTVPTFDSEAVVEVMRGGSAGIGTTAGHVGVTRYIQVTAHPEADPTKVVGKYTLGFKRLPTIVVQ